VLDQDVLEGIQATAAPLALIRKAFPRFMRQRTLMVGCVAGEGHLAGCDSLKASEVAEILAANLEPAARSLNARMIVLKEFPAHYRGALAVLQRNGFARVPSMPMTTMDVAHASFDEYMRRHLRSHARRHLKKNLAASSDIGLKMDVTHDVTPILEEVYALYLEVFGRAKLRFEKLTIDFLRLLGERMGDKMRFFTWRRNGRLVAFSMSMSEGDILYIEYIGLDYRVALDAHLYYAMFRDEYDWAARNGYRTIRSSGLGYDPKLHLRFDLYPIDLYVRHVSPLANAMLAPLLPRLVPAAYDPMLRKFANYGDIW
jgi:predicted N-acyltransferase